MLSTGRSRYMRIFYYPFGSDRVSLIRRNTLRRFGWCSVSFTLLVFSSILPIFVMLDRTADMFGRRYAMVVECVLFNIGIIIQLTTKGAWQPFAGGRFASGLAIGALLCYCPDGNETHYLDDITNSHLVSSGDRSISYTGCPHSNIPAVHYIWYLRRL